MKFLSLIVLLLLSFSLIAQNLYVEGSATIVGSSPLKVSTTGTSVLDLRGHNPLIEIRNNSATYLAFMQVFGSDLYLANRQSGNLFFRTNNLNRITINPDGNVGIGTTLPESKLTINGTENNGKTAGLEINSGSQKTIMDGNEIDCTSGALHLNYNSGHDVMVRTNVRRSEINLMHNNGSGNGNGVSIQHPGSNNVYWTLYSTNSDGYLELYYKGNLRGEFNSATGAYNQTSDRRLKRNIRPVSSVLERVRKLKPARYSYTADPYDRTQLGFVAQEVEPLFPELVHRGTVGDSDQEVYQLNYSGFGVVAVAAIQELLERQKKLMEENELMKAQIIAMESRLSRLENELTR